MQKIKFLKPLKIIKLLDKILKIVYLTILGFLKIATKPLSTSKTSNEVLKNEN